MLSEKRLYLRAGWKYEGFSWHLAVIVVYRLFNPKQQGTNKRSSLYLLIFTNVIDKLIRYHGWKTWMVVAWKAIKIKRQIKCFQNTKLLSINNMASLLRQLEKSIPRVDSRLLLSRHTL
ncbi:hypothetical protein JL36_06045 [Lactococcus cremoris]|nr:hypothetical protein JL36_06045 [Lactococcus cremoris]